MARQIIPINRFQGISDSEKEGITSSFLWARSVDYRTDPSKLMILPRSTKDSGTVVTDLVLDADRVGSDHYFYGDTGNIYKRTSAGVWTNERTVADSHGNGMAYFGEDDFLYYTSDTVIGRYGQIDADSPAWADDFMGAQGGIPLNTYCLDLEANSSQYAYAADSASLSITGDITIEGYFKLESLPAAATEVTLASKWDGSSDQRSYLFALAGVSAQFGDGSDGALTISSNTTDTPIDSACTGTAAAYSLSATNANFAAGQKILIHQSKGTGAGNWERNEIASYTAGTITLSNALTNTYASGAQVMVMKEYTNVTVNNGIVWTAKGYDGTVGGIMAFLANGTVTITGTINASSKGYAGGAGGLEQDQAGYQGYGYPGVGAYATQTANGNGGGAGIDTGDNWESGGGGGGGNGTAGSAGLSNGGSDQGAGGGTAGSADLTTMVFGGGGGGGGASSINGDDGGAGGTGGGIIFFYGADVTVTGAIWSIGGNGANGAGNQGAAGGGGAAGGSILIRAQTATLGSGKILASAGSGGTGTSGVTRCDGGAGGVGRIHLDYYTSYTGTTSPTLDATQDSNLVTNTTYQLKWSVSTDGTTTNQETLSKELPADPSTGTWYHWAAAWDASAASVEFFVNGVSIGTATGAKTSMYNSTANFAIGAQYNASGTAINYFDGLVDEIRVWNDLRTASELSANKGTEISGSSANLQAYWQLDNTTDDTTANANSLTLVNSPVYVTTVPFYSPTTRQDLDQSLDTTGNVYLVPSSINEGATHRQSFVPAKDPQKSVQILVAAIGSNEDWTLTVHDAQNRVIATKTIDEDDMVAGDVEFTFATPWRPVIGQTYHFHVTASSALISSASLSPSGSPSPSASQSKSPSRSASPSASQSKSPSASASKSPSDSASPSASVSISPSGSESASPSANTPQVTTTTDSDLETVDFHTYYQFLVDDNNHPIEHYIDAIYIGNERYLAKWDGISYSPHLITLPSGYHIRCLGQWREYLVMGVVVGDSLTDYEYGMLFFWDGVSDTYNFYRYVPQGAINSILSGDPMYFMAGYAGDFMIFDGGNPRKIRRMPFVKNSDTLSINRKALTMWRALVHIGFSSTCTSTDIYRGVYSYGTLNDRLSETLSFDYPLSLDVTQSANLEIGMLLASGTYLFTSWKNGSSYGVDTVKPSNALYATARYESLITDANKIWQEKNAMTLRGYFKALASGDSVQLEYKVDRESNWTEGTAVTTAGLKEARLPFPTQDTRFNELQVAIDLATTNTDSPEFYGFAIEYDDLTHERRV